MHTLVIVLVILGILCAAAFLLGNFPRRRP